MTKVNNRKKTEEEENAAFCINKMSHTHRHIHTYIIYVHPIPDLCNSATKFSV